MTLRPINGHVVWIWNHVPCPNCAFTQTSREGLYCLISWYLFKLSSDSDPDNYGPCTGGARLPTCPTGFLWLTTSLCMNGNKSEIFISSFTKGVNIFQNLLVGRYLDKIHKYYFRNSKLIHKLRPHTFHTDHLSNDLIPLNL